MKSKNNYLILGVIIILAFALRFFTNYYALFSISFFLTTFTSTASAIVLFLLARRLFDHEIALVAVFLFAIFPWHISLSLQSLITVVFVFFLTLSVYFGARNKRILCTFSLVLTTVFLGALVFRYQSFEEIIHEQHKTVIRQIVGGGEGQKPLIARFFHNKLVETVRFSLYRLSAYFEPQGFFLTSSYFFGKKIFGSGFVLSSVFPFFLYGFVQLLRLSDKNRFLLLWILFSPFPGIVSIHPQHAMLGSAMIPAIILISAFGLTKTVKKFPLIGVCSFIVISLNFLFVFSHYIQIIW